VNDLTVVGLEWLGALALFLGFILLVRYLDHRERMSMIERGLLDNLDGNSARPPRGSAMLRGGLITAMVGMAVTIGLYTLGYLLPAPFSAVPGRFGPWLLPGLIPLAVGLALVASYYLSPPRPERHTDDQSSPAEPPTEEEARRPDLRVLDTRRPGEQHPRRDDAANG
jgi:hypothetical protein